MQGVLKKIIEFVLLVFSISLLAAGILKYAFPRYFGKPSYWLLVLAGLMYLIQRYIKRKIHC